MKAYLWIYYSLNLIILGLKAILFIIASIWNIFMYFLSFIFGFEMPEEEETDENGERKPFKNDFSIPQILDNDIEYSEKIVQLQNHLENVTEEINSMIRPQLLQDTADLFGNESKKQKKMKKKKNKQILDSPKYETDES